jgi:hypothetical protein
VAVHRRTKAKRWFCSEEEAIAAGFRKAYVWVVVMLGDAEGVEAA